MSSTEQAVVELRAAVSQAIARLFADFYGKGPSRTRTYIYDDFVFVVAEDVLTPAEEALRALGDEELIGELRHAFEDVMTNGFVGEVEQIVGRTVVGYHSQVLPAAGAVFEVFVLDPTQPGLAMGEPGGDWEPGAPGDADALPSVGEAPPPAPHADASRPRADQGELRAALSSAVVRAAQQVFGRGASRARAYVADRFVFCALEDPLTRAEATLAAGDRQDLVRRLRHRLLHGASGEFTAPVEALVGRPVLDAGSQVVFDPDVAFLVFMLDDRVAD